MSYRPVTDTWILARARLKGGAKYYGAYPGGFPERARTLLGITMNDRLLHACGGCAALYPYARGFGPHDCTLDLDETLAPTYWQNVLDPIPLTPEKTFWPAILADPPYTEADAEKYRPGKSKFPSANAILKNCLEVVRVGGPRWNSPLHLAATAQKCAFQVLVGFNNRVRLYSVYERTA